MLVDVVTALSNFQPFFDLDIFGEGCHKQALASYRAEAIIYSKEECRAG